MCFTFKCQHTEYYTIYAHGTWHMAHRQSFKTPPINAKIGAVVVVVVVRRPRVWRCRVIHVLIAPFRRNGTRSVNAHAPVI